MPSVARNFPVSNALEYARQQMIRQQVRTWEVLEPRVLEVLAAVRREDFVPSAYRQVAFADAAVPLGYGQCMLAPKIDGKILQALNLQAGDQALDIGTGSGFLAACMGRMAMHVRSVEILPELAACATANLHLAAANNVVVETFDATQLVEEQRYDAIAISCSLPVFDERFQRALKIGGRLFVVVGGAPVMEACKITRRGGEEFIREPLFETCIEPMTNARRPSGFTF